MWREHQQVAVHDDMCAPCALQDPNPQVKDTTAWTISRIFEFLHDAGTPNPIITPDLLPGIMAMLLESLKVVACCVVAEIALRPHAVLA